MKKIAEKSEKEMEGKAKKGCDIKDKVKSLETNFEATLKLSLRVRGNTR